MVRQETGENSAVLGRHASRLVQPGIVADNLRAALLRAAARRPVRAAGRVLRPALRERLVSDAAEAVRGRVPDVHPGPVHRRPAQVEPLGLGHRGRSVVAAHRTAAQRAHHVHHAVRPRRVENDTDAKGTFEKF